MGMVFMMGEYMNGGIFKLKLQNVYRIQFYLK
jgi:hypothetical protein